MKLTKNEIEIADRYISKRERQVARWPRSHWLILAIFTVFTFIGYHALSDGVRSIQDDRFTDLLVDRAARETPPPGQEQLWLAGTMMKISKILELRYQVVTYSLMEVAVGSMQILWGVTIICFVILRWNTGQRDALICKLLRGKLQELEPDAAPNPPPPSQPRA